MPSAVLPVHPLVARLKFRHFRVILALDELQSAAEVATKLHISPAAVSKTLAEVEAIVGMPLFERGRRGMRATQIGREMIEGAALVTAQLSRLAESLQAVREGTQGQLSIAYRTTSVQPILAQLICAFHECNPRVDVSVIDGGIMELINQVEEGELDLLFAYEDPRLDRKDLCHSPVIAAQQLVIVASTTHPLLRQGHISAQDLVDQQWCIPAHGARMLHHLHTALRALDLPPPQRGIRTSDVAMTVNLLQAAHFLAVYPERIAAQLAAANVARVVPFKLASQVEPVVMVWNGTLAPRAPARVFRDFILRRAETMPADSSAWLANVGMMKPA
ncbi:LysR family transcriptional regulator [Cupriavidus basilensis]